AGVFHSQAQHVPTRNNFNGAGHGRWWRVRWKTWRRGQPTLCDSAARKGYERPASLATNGPRLLECVDEYPEPRRIHRLHPKPVDDRCLWPATSTLDTVARNARPS